MFDWVFKKSIARHPETGFPILGKEDTRPNQSALVITAAISAVALITVWKRNGKEKRS
jgi:hypothetical protein